jgi:hypothetical protein
MTATLSLIEKSEEIGDMSDIIPVPSIPYQPFRCMLSDRTNRKSIIRKKRRLFRSKTSQLWSDIKGRTKASFGIPGARAALTISYKPRLHALFFQVLGVRQKKQVPPDFLTSSHQSTDDIDPRQSNRGTYDQFGKSNNLKWSFRAYAIKAPYSV